MWLLLVIGFYEILKADWLSFGLISLWEAKEELARTALGGSIPEAALLVEATLRIFCPAAAASLALLCAGLTSVIEEFLTSSANCCSSGCSTLLLSAETCCPLSYCCSDRSLFIIFEYFRLISALYTALFQ